MKKQFFFWAVCLLAGFRTASAQDFPESCPDECTSIAVGRLATTDGSVFTSHTCDGVSHSWVSIEKAADHPRGAMTPIYKGTRKNFFRGDTTGVKIVGEVPQVAHTYAYLNTGYPSLNEKQVAIGETTFSGPDTLRNYGSMFVVEELCRLALERCDNARDAVILMGSLGEKYGYADGGECLTVADKNEVWFFEILGCGRGKKGAVWAAQRVPDGEVAVSANIPRIGRLRRGDPDFLCSDNVESVARTYNLWDGEGEFIFWKAFNAAYGNGRNFREREWFIFNTLAPSLQLSFDAPELPFSVKPDTLVDVRTLKLQIMPRQIHRNAAKRDAVVTGIDDVLADALDHIKIQLIEKPCILERANEGVGIQEPVRGINPAGQGLETIDAAAQCAHNRLIESLHEAALESLIQMTHEIGL